MDRPAVAELMADVAAAVGRRVAAVSEDVYEVILREIPELRNSCGPGCSARWVAWPLTMSTTPGRDTLLVFLQNGGSYEATAEQLILHKNTVQYRVRKAEESLGRPVGDNRQDVELALQATHWLGSSVLRPPAAGHHRDSQPHAG